LRKSSGNGVDLKKKKSKNWQLLYWKVHLLKKATKGKKNPLAGPFLFEQETQDLRKKRFGEKETA